MPPDNPPASADAASKPSIFITYAREDEEFVFKLRDRLTEEGIEVRGDWQLQAGFDYKTRLGSFILQSDALVFIISPYSAGSLPCKEELTHAVEQKKRVLPVLRRGVVDDNLLDSALRAPHWTILTDDKKFDQGVSTLVESVKTDAALADVHSRLLVNADDWRSGGRNRSSLLRKESLKEAEAWLAKTSRQPDKLPQPTALQLEYIFASQRARSRGSRIAFLVVSSIALVLGASTLFAISRANAAVRSSYEAENTAVRAGWAQLDAEEATRVAQMQQRIADANFKEAERQRKEALRQKGIAETNEKEATRQEGIAVVNAAEARRQQGIAEENQRTAERNAEEARRRLADLLEEQGRQESVGGDPQRALLYLSRALEVGGDNPRLNLLLTRAALSFEGQTATMIGHKRTVTTSAFSPDGRLVITASDDRTAKLWDANTGALLRTFTSDAGKMINAVLSPDGSRVITEAKHLASGADITPTVLWDAQTGARRGSVNVEYTNEFKFTADGRRYLHVEGWTPTVREADAGKELFRIGGHDEDVLSAALDEQTDRTLSADTSKVVLHGAGGGELFSFVPRGAPVKVFFGAGGPRAVTKVAAETKGGKAESILWDAQTGRPLAALDLATDGRNVFVSPDGSRVALLSGLTVKLLDAGTGRVLSSATLPQTRATGTWVTKVSANLSRVARCSGTTVEVFKTADASRVSVFEVYGGEIKSLALSPDGSRALTFTRDNIGRVWIPEATRSSRSVTFDSGATAAVFNDSSDRIITFRDEQKVAGYLRQPAATVWDAASGRAVVGRDDTEGVVTLAVAPDGHRRLVASAAGLEIRDIEHGGQVVALEKTGCESLPAKFSPDGRRLAGVCGSRVAVWDAASGKLTARPPASAPGESAEPEGQDIVNLRFSPDGTRLVTFTFEDDELGVINVKVWDAATGVVITPHGFNVRGSPYDQTPVISRDNRLLITAGGFVALGSRRRDDPESSTASTETPHVWDANDDGGGRPKPLFTLEGHTGDINHIAFSPDDKLIVTASDDSTARIWEAATGELVAALAGHEGQVRSAVFSPDGEFVLTVSDKFGEAPGVAKLWYLRTSQTLATFGGDQLMSVRTAGFSPDGARVVVTSDKGTVAVWDIAVERYRREGLSERVARLMPYKFVEGRAVPVFSRGAADAAPKRP